MIIMMGNVIVNYFNSSFKYHDVKIVFFLIIINNKNSVVKYLIITKKIFKKILWKNFKYNQWYDKQNV